MSANKIKMTIGAQLKTILLHASEYLDKKSGVQSSITPPRYLSLQYGGGNFHDIGFEFFKILLDKCDLSRDSAVLDIGCGVGRIATPLQYYITPPGSYQGVDIMPDGIEYCRANITPVFPHFKFDKIDVYNSFYNPDGRNQPEDYTFEFADASFDLIISTSLMTHLKPKAAARYVAETARMLKPGGVSMHTFFVLDDFAQRQIDADRSVIKFRHRVEDFVTSSLKYVEQAIAIPETAVRAMYESAGLAIEIHPGSWCGADPALTFQNVVVGRKPA